MAPKRKNHIWKPEEDDFIITAYRIGCTKGEQIRDLPGFSKISDATYDKIDTRIRHLKKTGQLNVENPEVTPAHQNIINLARVAKGIEAPSKGRGKKRTYSSESDFDDSEEDEEDADEDEDEDERPKKRKRKAKRESSASSASSSSQSPLNLFNIGKHFWFVYRPERLWIIVRKGPGYETKVRVYANHVRFITTNDTPTRLEYLRWGLDVESANESILKEVIDVNKLLETRAQLVELVEDGEYYKVLRVLYAQQSEANAEF